ncbi:MAG: hypothetical protein FWD15_05660, partial [Alphaproteobacteria bacterium]|nr:hypothetical protein [Alphaproteobacteria bacterium]
MNYIRNFYRDRAIAAVEASIDAEAVNLETNTLKQWFAQQTRSSTAVLGTSRGGKVISADWETLFKDGNEAVAPAPSTTPWLQLFAIHNEMRKQATEYMKGLLVPTLQALAEQVISNSTWHPNFDKWFERPLDWLRKGGDLHAHEIDRRNKEGGKAFTTGRGDEDFKLGYHEIFKAGMGEVYCETDDEEPCRLHDRLIACEGI